MTPEEWKKLPLVEIVIPDPGPTENFVGGKPYAYVEADGVPVGRLAITGARHEVGINGLSQVHISLHAGDVELRSRPRMTWKTVDPAGDAPRPTSSALRPAVGEAPSSQASLTDDIRRIVREELGEATSRRVKMIPGVSRP